ncbi:hypothetical protein E4O05_09920 [Treponema sp. OMZ 787]|uniref:hypothetical protein n=1 Tax=Treponema sp. OMZ 787 TaxID=2563669 RepID=UPI0020A5C006|nr:hypothetical protein [Treponema sp. OMZ 787]UTC61837.1 hypothetical protein E4O05_09920 [Treponema sp. OMZ 787]
MKKLLFFMLILVLAVSSCNFLINDEYGELVLGFDGSLPDGSRALDSNGLPILASSRLEVRIIGESGSIITRSLKADEPKSLVELVPIGEKVEITVTAYNPSAQWSGKKTHTVTSGQNRVTVLLSKKASGLNNLLFTRKKTDSSEGVPSYSLTLHMDGKTINVPESTRSEHIFSRDSKGRVDVLYKRGDTYFVRYTSEGELDEHPAQAAVGFLANDYTTGKMYGKQGHDLKEIKENLHLESVTSAGINGIFFAVDNDRIVQGSLNDGFYFSKIGSSASNRIPGSQFAGLIHRLGVDYLNEEEFFIRGDYLYILLSGSQYTLSAYNDNVFSLGAVIKWKLGEKAVTPAYGGGTVMLPHLVGVPIVIGKPEGLPAFENHVLKNYDYSKNFYGAVKVIGFDDENLYIADDGFDAADTPAGARVVKNRNRIAILNMQTNELTFTDAGTAKWNNEWKEWKAPNTKTIVWNKTHFDGGTMFGSTTFKEQGSSDKLFKTASNEDGLFAFDQSGVLYIPYTDGSNKIKRFIQDDDGAYEEGEEFEFPTPPHLPGAMAVDTSRSHKLTAQKAGSVSEENYYNVLYCIGGNNDINRFVWTGDFSDAFKDDPYSVADPGWRITALAANKDGLFAALMKSETPPTGTPTYGIKINRYDKVSKALLGTVVLVPEGTSEKVGAFSINEKITDMHIQDGNLYVLTLKEMREDNSTTDKRLFTSGKLWYISSTADFGDNKRVLYKSPEKTSEPDTLEKNFAPLRFIAVKPKKLVIASDGYYGEKYDWHCIKNFDKVFTFDIGSWNSPVGEPIENTTFTKVLTVSAEYEFLP